MSAHVLILAGTAEARTLVERLAVLPGLRVTASLAGVTSNPAPIAAETRTGGFGGPDGLAAWLGAHRVAALIDATHPFAARMAANAATACAATGTPRLKLLRPVWQPVGDWHSFPEPAVAAAALPPGARPLITTGRKEVAPFAARPDLACLLRVIEPVADLPEHITQIVARPPFTLETELALMRAHAITHLLAKNAGGSGRARLDAAARLGLPILMVERPAPPPGPRAAGVADAVAWLLETVAIRP
ncbi:MAG TPA: cobalt-precorrin-6A reductase [Thermohalobaculum sp.]|nr:cobalt-precorrin-6A reductase [Thermohalobaculum sp.]